MESDQRLPNGRCGGLRVERFLLLHGLDRWYFRRQSQTQLEGNLGTGPRELGPLCLACALLRLRSYSLLRLVLTNDS